jgi:hypothetical protein
LTADAVIASTEAVLALAWERSLLLPTRYPCCAFAVLASARWVGAYWPERANVEVFTEVYPGFTNSFLSSAALRPLSSAFSARLEASTN